MNLVSLKPQNNEVSEHEGMTFGRRPAATGKLDGDGQVAGDDVAGHL